MLASRLLVYFLRLIEVSLTDVVRRGPDERRILTCFCAVNIVSHTERRERVFATHTDV